MIYKVIKRNKKLSASINLPASKSESNRALIIRSLCKKKFTINNLSEAEDTKILALLLKRHQSGKDANPVYNVGAAGTVMRFLTAFFSVQPGKTVTLTGTERMKERPVKILVNALRSLGAEIVYQEKEGYPPLKISGKKLSGKKITVDGGISSQYISALLMIAPLLENGLEIIFKGKLISKPYISMTLRMMKCFGIKYTLTDKKVFIPPQEYKEVDFTVESDWSAASYWYEMAAFSDTVDIKLAGLKKNSLQGDAAVAAMYKKLGLITQFNTNGIRITKERALPDRVIPAKIDFTDCPDLAQTLAVTLAGLGWPALLTGLKSLRIKETDRIMALQKELNKTAVFTKILRANDLKILPSANARKMTAGFNIMKEKLLCISTYNDHRMAMAFAPLAVKFGEICIDHPEVVKKSYPGYWADLRKAGFVVKSISR